MRNNSERGVIAIKPSSTKEGQERVVKQAAKMTTESIYSGIQLVNAFVSSGNLQQLAKDAGAIYKETPFKYLLLYSASEFTDSSREFRQFCESLAQQGIIVRALLTD